MNNFQRVPVILASNKVTACEAPRGGMTWILHTHNTHNTHTQHTQHTHTTHTQYTHNPHTQHTQHTHTTHEHTHNTHNTHITHTHNTHTQHTHTTHTHALSHNTHYTRTRTFEDFSIRVLLVGYRIQLIQTQNVWHSVMTPSTMCQQDVTH